MLTGTPRLDQLERCLATIFTYISWEWILQYLGCSAFKNSLSGIWMLYYTYMSVLQRIPQMDWFNALHIDFKLQKHIYRGTYKMLYNDLCDKSQFICALQDIEV
jgi:hypothetical protein